MLQPENQSKKYQHLFTGIDSGQIKIPKFQRDFVGIWDDDYEKFIKKRGLKVFNELNKRLNPNI